MASKKKRSRKSVEAPGRESETSSNEASADGAEPPAAEAIDHVSRTIELPTESLPSPPDADEVAAERDESSEDSQEGDDDSAAPADGELSESTTRAVEKRMQLLEKRHDELELALDQQTEETDRARSQAAEARAAYEAMASEVEAERAAHEATRARLHAQVADPDKPEAPADEEVEQLRTRIRQLEEALDKLHDTTRVDVDSTEAAASTSAVQRLEEELDDEELDDKGATKLDELERSLQEAIEDRNRLMRALKRVERQHNSIISEVLNRIESATETIADRESLEIDARSARAALRRAHDYCESVDLALNVVGSELSGAREGFDTALGQLKQTAGLATGYRSRADRFGETVTRARERIATLVSSLNDLTDDLEGMGSLLSDEENERHVIGEAVSEAFEILSGHDDGLAQLADRLQSQRNALTGLAGELDAATEADEMLQGEVARRDAAYREHIEAVTAFESDLEGIAEQIERAQHGKEEADVSGDVTTTPADWVAAVRSGATRLGKDGDVVTTTMPSVPNFGRMAYTRLNDRDLSAAERLAPLHAAKPSIESSRLSDSMEISAKAAFLVSSIDGSVTLGDLIDLSGLHHEEAAQILVNLLLDGHIRIPKL